MQTAEARAEEAAVREAIAQVEAAERREAEENERRLRARVAEVEAEQARLAHLMEEVENKRRDGITAFYQNLRNALRELHTSHRKALAKRFESDRHKIDRVNEVWAVDQKAQAVENEWEKANVQSKKNIFMDELRQKHTNENFQTVARHKVDEELVSARLNERLERAIPKLDCMERLWKVQRNERATLRMHQAQELQKWQDRFATEIAAVETRLRRQQEKTVMQFQAEVDEAELARRIFADRKWYEVLTEEQQGMLDADERRLLISGGDAPSRDSMTVADDATAAGTSQDATEGVGDTALAIRASYGSLFYQGTLTEHTSRSGSTGALTLAAMSATEPLELRGQRSPRTCTLDRPRPLRVGHRVSLQAGTCR